MTASHLPPGLNRAVAWVGTALPVGLCGAIWLLGTDIRWLGLLHHAIGVGVLAWTALRLARRPGDLRPSLLMATLKERWLAQRCSVTMVYGLLMLQPVLELAGRMLAGDAVVLWGVPLPPVLPANAALAQDVIRAHGLNALLLLGLIGAHIVAEIFVSRGKLPSPPVPRFHPASPGGSQSR